MAPNSQLPPSHRKPLGNPRFWALLYFLVPYCLFVGAWLQPLPATVAVLLPIGLLVWAWRQGSLSVDPVQLYPRQWRMIAFMAVFFLIMVLFSTFFHLLTDRARTWWVLNKLIEEPWPAVFHPGDTEKLQAPVLFNYYFGAFLVPAALGKLLGIYAGHFGYILWMVGGFVLGATLLSKAFPSARWVVPGVFFIGLLEPLTFLPTLWQEGLMAALKGLIHKGSASELFVFQETQGLEGPDLFRLWMRSSMVQLIRSEFHFIPAFITTSWLLYEIRQPLRRSLAGWVVGLSPLYTVLPALGLLPYIVFLLLRNGLRPHLNGPNILGAMVPLGVLGLFFNGHAPVERVNTVMAIDWSLAILAGFLGFYLVKFAPLLVGNLGLAKLAGRDAYYRPLPQLGWWVLAFLFLLTSTSLGPTSDLMMRASIPGLMLGSVFCVLLLEQLRMSCWWRRLFWAFLLLAALRPVMESFRWTRVLLGNYWENPHLHFASTHFKDWFAYYNQEEGKLELYLAQEEKLPEWIFRFPTKARREQPKAERED